MRAFLRRSLEKDVAVVVCEPTCTGGEKCRSLLPEDEALLEMPLGSSLLGLVRASPDLSPSAFCPSAFSLSALSLSRTLSAALSIYSKKI